MKKVILKNKTFEVDIASKYEILRLPKLDDDH